MKSDKKELPQNAVTLTPDQKEAFTRIIAFLGSKAQAYILRGYAGAGKTFLIRLIAQYLKNAEREFYLIAPTGRAARILAVKTGYSASTIHSLIYAGAEESKLLDAAAPPVSLNFSMKHNTHAPDAVYIVDESSMIDDSEGASGFLNFGSGKLLCDFFTNARMTEGAKKQHLHRQVLFVGDPVQLPPVKQKFSCALSAEYLSQQYRIAADEFTLTQVVRQAKDSPILNFATAVRDCIVDSSYDTAAFSSGNRHAIQRYELVPKWKGRVAEQGEEQSIVITHSNKQALQYNRLLRGAKYGTAGDELRTSDRLLVVNNNRLYGMLNGDIVDVVKLEKGTEKISVTPRFGGGEPVSFFFKEVTIGYTNEYNKYVTSQCKLLLNLMLAPSASMMGNEYFALKQLAVEECGVEPPSKTLKKRDPEKYKERMEDFEMALAASPYLNALQVKYGYAVTCHKAQGGEWNNVFVDFDAYIKDSEEYFRWLYTAITRTKEELFCLNMPDDSGSQGGYRYIPID
jgi:ATP-dependent exoDNAse (exonuclease V) alpha subunit